MASITKKLNGSWKVEIKVGTFRKSKTFQSKKEAQSWGFKTELELNEQLKNKSTLEIYENYSLLDAVNRYVKEILPSKKGARSEHIRLVMYQRLFPQLFSKKIQQIGISDIAKIRDERCVKVSNASVLRELTTLSAVFEAAKRDWEWIDKNPVHEVRKPPSSPHRERIITRFEVKAMLKIMGWRPNRIVNTLSQSLACAFRLALRTGMRAGELCNMQWKDVHENYIHLPTTKNGKKRDVPLTKKSKRIINAMKRFDVNYVFSLTPTSLSSLFRRYRILANLKNFTFHDTRHTAATWIASNLKSKNINAQQAVMDMCKIFGWSNMNQALTYYNPNIDDIRQRLE